MQIPSYPVEIYKTAYHWMSDTDNEATFILVRLHRWGLEASDREKYSEHSRT